MSNLPLALGGTTLIYIDRIHINENCRIHMLISILTLEENEANRRDFARSYCNMQWENPTRKN